MADLLQQEYFLMTQLGQQYNSIEDMPLYEAEMFIDMKIDELKAVTGS